MFGEHHTRFRERLSWGSHARTADAGAQLLATWTVLLDFANEVGVTNIPEREALWSRVETAVDAALTSQAAQQTSGDPISRFTELLADGLASGRVHVHNYGTGGYPGGGWGWERPHEGTLAAI